jgi:hypothetical protein
MFKCAASLSEPNEQLRIGMNDAHNNTMSFPEFIDKFLEYIIDFTKMTYGLVSIRKFSNIRSKGRQLEITSQTVKERLIEELSKGIYYVFFAFEEPRELPNGEKTLIEVLLDLKKEELSDRADAEAGRPSWKYCIPVIEYLHLIGRITTERKQVIYSQIWKPLPLANAKHLLTE